MEVLEATEQQISEINVSDYEIERGKPMPSKNHNRVQTMIAHILMLHYFDKFDVLTEADLELSTGWTVPDVVIFPKLVYDWVHDEIKMTELPITTIEILSPKQSIADLIIKAQDKYLAAGVKSSWIVVPPLQQITILYPNGTSETFTKGTLNDTSTGVEVELSQIFR